MQVRNSPRLVRALGHSSVPTQQKKLDNRLLRRPRGWHESAPLLQEQRRFLLLRGGERTERRPLETRQVCLEVDGLTCGSCVAKAERAILSVNGVLEVREKLAVFSRLRVSIFENTRTLLASTTFYSLRRRVLCRYTLGNAWGRNTFSTSSQQLIECNGKSYFL